MKFIKKIPTEPGVYWVKMPTVDEPFVAELFIHTDEYFQEDQVYFLYIDCVAGCQADSVLWGDQIEIPEVT